MSVCVRARSEEVVEKSFPTRFVSRPQIISISTEEKSLWRPTNLIFVYNFLI